jgi:hypothetical protein
MEAAPYVDRIEQGTRTKPTELLGVVRAPMPAFVG